MEEVKKKSSGGSSGRRVSFLMPYIDFCFMLIIIFVSMLSIAYFDPLGRTDIQIQQDSSPDRLQGKNEITPEGIQNLNSGLGAENNAKNDIKPLTGRSEHPVQIADTFRSELSPSPHAPGRDAPGVVSLQEMNALKKEIVRLKAEMARLQNVEQQLKAKETELARLHEVEKQLDEFKKAVNRTGPLPLNTEGHGNHVYLDLRSGK